jgi:hypothetical protein
MGEMMKLRNMLAACVLVSFSAGAWAGPIGIHDAARFGDVDQVLSQIAADSTLVNARTGADETPLHYAVLGQNIPVAELLLATGADASARDSSGRTPLHVAAQFDDPKLIQMLIAAGADVNAADSRGETPLHVAARRFKGEALSALLAAGADVHARNAAGETPLHVLGAAMRAPDPAFFQLLDCLAAQLIAAGADPAIIAHGYPALQPQEVSEQGAARDSWVVYADIGPDLLALETAYPDLARRYDLGTSVQGRHLWALKISDNVDQKEDEPEFKYISTIHGDEIVGVKTCMLLCDYLLSNYGTDPQCTQIVDETELWIVPLMNPDGYDRTPRTRENAHGVDLNRTFPNYGEVPSPEGREPEVQVIMNWSAQHTFICSANFHGGALVVNYPYDNDDTGTVHTPDDDLMVYISEQYSQYNPPMWSSSSFYHGITCGADWYMIWGGMQDWNYHFMGNNEVTIELGTKQPSASEIPTYWNNNRQSMMAYILTAQVGIRGLVTDAITGAPLAATVTVVGRNHNIYTDPGVGDYHRMLMPGTYQLHFQAAGYDPLTVSDIVVASGAATRRDVQLYPAPIVTYPNGGEQLGAGVTTDITWTGNPDAQFQVQYTANADDMAEIVDDFERTSLGPAYTTGGSQVWITSTSSAHGGARSAKAGTITHNQVTWMQRVVGQGGEVSFWYRVSSEPSYDFFNFYVDGSRQVHDSGESGWRQFATTLADGSHTLKWEYSKDVSLSSGYDTAWVDDLSIVADQTVWTDVIALTEVGATSAAWMPTDIGERYKVRVRSYVDGMYGEWDASDAPFTVVDIPPFPPGDLNCDGAVNAFDIDPFVLALTDPAGYQAQYSHCDRMLADCNGDGEVNAFDIDPFVLLLTGG